MKLIDYRGKEVVLVNEKTGIEYTKGDIVTNFRGVLSEITSIEPPHKSSASGKVNNYYASVYGLKFTDKIVV